jgi:ribosomal-protein-serine acetyltransferase
MQQPTTADIPGQQAKPSKPSGPASALPVGLSPHEVSQNLPAVCLRRFQPEDAHRLFEAVRESADALCAYMTWCRPGYSLADARSFIAQCEAGWEAEEQYHFAIVDVRNEVLLGGVGLNRVDWNHRCANIGCWVRRSRTRQGVATAAARLIARYGLEELGFQRLEILFPASNAASQRVAQKTGAKFEGALRNRLVLPDGIHDAFLYSLVAGDLAALPISPTT